MIILFDTIPSNARKVARFDLKDCPNTSQYRTLYVMPEDQKKLRALLKDIRTMSQEEFDDVYMSTFVRD